MIPALLAACGAPPPESLRQLDDALAARDEAVILAALPGRVGLRRWLVRQPPDARLSLAGRRVRVGGNDVVLDARLTSSPGRWQGDRWPLGSLRFGDVAPVDPAGPERITGEVWLDRAAGSVEARLSLESNADLVAFRLVGRGGWLAPSRPMFSASASWDTGGGVWVVGGSADVWYRLWVRPEGFDLLQPDVLALLLSAWLPEPVAHDANTELDLVVHGAGDLELRSGGPLRRAGDDWHLTGPIWQHDVVVGRPTWTHWAQDVGGTRIDVATDPGGPTDPEHVWTRTAEAVAALGPLGPLPETLFVSEVPRGRGAHAGPAHVALPTGDLGRDPLSMAHEIVHVLSGVHPHPPSGIPSLEEAAAEHLSQRAARSPEEARVARVHWRHAMDVREGDDGRPLLDAWRLYSAQYFRGALILGALEAWIGEAAMLGLLLPLSERTTVPWEGLAEAVEAQHPDVRRRLRALLEARDLPKPVVRQVGGGFVVADAGGTPEIDIEVDVDLIGDDGAVIARHRVQIGDGRVLPLPAGARAVVDPDARAPIRLRRSDGRSGHGGRDPGSAR
jgi:hypothetical protein